MAKKWYNLFVSVAGSEEGRAEATAPTAAQTVAEIAASIPQEPAFAARVANPASFDEIYSAAEIRPAENSYTIMKVADMLQSEHIRALPREVKRSSILLAIEAAGGKIEDVVQDAVRRDRALDTFERVQEQALQALDARKSKENQEIQSEMDRLVAEYRARIQTNNDEVARERERFYGWRLQKQQEEQKIADAVSYFVSENPISTRGAAAAPSPKPAQQ